MRTRSGAADKTDSRPSALTTGNSTTSATAKKDAITKNTNTRRRGNTTTTSPPSSPKQKPDEDDEKKTKKKKMNNAENYATVEIKRKQAKEDSRWDQLERGEKPRNFEKPDKPDDDTSEKQKNTADSLSQLPPEDLKNVGVLALLCIFYSLILLM